MHAILVCPRESELSGGHALKHGRAVVYNVRHYVESSVVPVDELAVVPDFVRLLNCHGASLTYSPFSNLPIHLRQEIRYYPNVRSSPLHKVTLKLCDNDLAHVRFAFNPLFECFFAFRAWLDPSRHALLLPWITKARPRIANIDWEPLTSLASLPRGSIPDFLVTQATTPLPSFADELACLRQVPPQVVRAETRIAYRNGKPRALRSAISDPRSFLVRIAALLEEFWERALAQEWPVFRSKLEAEVLFRARALALGGAEALVKGIHRDVS